MLFVRNDLVPYVSAVQTAKVASGLGNVLGNKGGVGVSFRIGVTDFLFVNSHFAAHQNFVHPRNQDFHKVNTDLPLYPPASNAHNSPSSHSERNLEVDEPISALHAPHLVTIVTDPLPRKKESKKDPMRTFSAGTPKHKSSSYTSSPVRSPADSPPRRTPEPVTTYPDLHRAISVSGTSHPHSLPRSTLAVPPTSLLANPIPSPTPKSRRAAAIVPPPNLMVPLPSDYHFLQSPSSHHSWHHPPPQSSLGQPQDKGHSLSPVPSPKHGHVTIHAPSDNRHHLQASPWQSANGSLPLRVDSAPLSPTRSTISPNPSPSARWVDGPPTRRIRSEKVKRSKSEAASERFDRVFWMGDLNYRIKGTREEVDEHISQFSTTGRAALIQRDELLYEMLKGNVFEGFLEGELWFRPTYKFNDNSDVYDTSSKRRVPAYTDRILFRDNSMVPGTNQAPSIDLIAYDSCSTVRTSDHRPVFAVFQIRFETAPQKNLS